jgi:transcriptional regulator with XRE-family HTH domain
MHLSCAVDAMHCAPNAIDMSSRKGFAFCVKRDKVVRPSTTPKSGAVIDAGRKAAMTAIREARLRAELTQEKAAALRGHATSTISRWETGALPQTWQELDEYAKALGQPIVLSFGAEREEAHPGEPEWASAMESRIVGELQLYRQLIESILPPERMAEARELIASLEAQLRTRGAAPPERTARSDPDAESPQAQADESPPVRAVEK